MHFGGIFSQFIIPKSYPFIQMVVKHARFSGKPIQEILQFFSSSRKKKKSVIHVFVYAWKKLSFVVFFFPLHERREKKVLF